MRSREQYFAPARPKALETLRRTLELPNAEKKTIDEQVTALFAVNDKEPAAEAREFGNLLKACELVLAERREAGKNIAFAPTIKETFASNHLDKSALTADGLFYLLPKQDGGDLIVISDTHGYRQGVEEAVRLFFQNAEHNHLASLGDNINIGPDQMPVVKALLKLAIQYPDRVHLLRGNNEVDINAGWDDSIYKTQGDPGVMFNSKRAKRLFDQLPLVLIAENGPVALHGNLPGPTFDKDKNHYDFRDLKQLQSALARSATTRFRVLWGEKSKQGVADVADQTRKHEFRGLKYLGKHGVLGAMDAIGAQVELVGHQHSYAAQFGSEQGHPGFALTHDERVGTLVTLPNGAKREGAIAVLPLGEEINKLTNENFQIVKYESQNKNP